MSSAAQSAFVLVHGGGHGSWCWERMIPFLARPTLAIDLPGRNDLPEVVGRLTLDDFADSAVRDIEASGFKKVCLVGHSAAGCVLPEVAARIPDRIERLVFVSCLIAAEGGTPIDAAGGILGLFSGFLSWRARRKGVIQLPRWLARYVLCSDLDPATSRLVLDRQSPEPAGIIFRPISRASMPRHIPRTYVKLLRDRALPPWLQDRFVEALGGADVVTFDAGHDAMLSRPRELASLLNRLVESASSSAAVSS